MTAKKNTSANSGSRSEIHAALEPGEWLGLQQAAEHVNRSERFIRRLVKERRVRYYKHGHFLAFRKTDLDAWAVSDCREPAP
jgi:excisionase family DNA binding protein